MGTTAVTKYKINGVLDTNKTVMENLESLTNSCASWLTYDINNGKWAVVINQAGTATYSFNDDNIIGNINLATTGLDQTYNAVEVQFPNIDIDQQNDFVRLEMLAADLNDNEQPNLLTITYPLIDEPIQAQLLGLIELKQSRVNNVVTFKIDFSNIDLQAGDLFDLTSAAHEWTAKVFRVLKLTEVDDAGGIAIEVMAIEYDADVYDETDLNRYLRTNADGVITDGAIGKPGTPQVTAFTEIARPYALIESDVPDNTDPVNQAGIVEDMEFWIYIIPGAELPNWELVDDDARNYTLHTTLHAPGGGTFVPGETAELEIDNLATANFLVKTRAKNSTTTSPYSAHSGLVVYVPAQTPDQITEEVSWVDSLGNYILGYALMQLMDDIMNGNLTGPGSLYDKIFSLFDDDPETPNRLAEAGAVTSTYVSRNSYSIPATYNSRFLVDNVVFPQAGIYEIFVYGDILALSGTTTNFRTLEMFIDGTSIASSSLTAGDGSFNDLSAFGWINLTAGTHPLELEIVNVEPLVTGIDVDIMIHYLGASV